MAIAPVTRILDIQDSNLPSIVLCKTSYGTMIVAPGLFNVGDKAVYVPTDRVIPDDVWMCCGVNPPKERIDYGLLLQFPFIGCCIGNHEMAAKFCRLQEGDDAAPFLGITKTSLAVQVCRAE